MLKDYLKRHIKCNFLLVTNIKFYNNYIFLLNSFLTHFSEESMFIKFFIFILM